MQKKASIAIFLMLLGFMKESLRIVYRTKNKRGKERNNEKGTGKRARKNER